MSAPSGASSPGGFRRVLQDVTGFAGSQYFMRFASLLKGFVVARLLGPEGNGAWQHFVIISEYCQYSHLGALPGLNKVLGHRIGEGDEAGEIAARRTGLGAVLVAALVLWAGLVAWVIWRRDELAFYDVWGLPLLGLVVLLEQVQFTYMALLRAHSRIHLISLLSAFFAAANLVVSLALLPKFKVLGLLIGWAITRGITMLWMIRRSGYSFRPKIDPVVLKGLLVTGFPIFLVLLTKVGTRNIDRVLVDSVLDKSQLGIYGLAVTISSLVRYVAEAVAFVIYPLFLRRYGETRDPRALAGRLTEPTAFLSLAVPGALGFSYLVLHLPILWLLPEFVPSIEIYRLLTISVAFSCLSILPGYYLMAIDRQNWLVPIGLGMIAFNFFAGRELIARGFGLAGVAAAMGTATFLYCTAVLAYSGRFALGSTAAAAAWIVRSYLPIAYFAAMVAALLAVRTRAPWAAWGEGARAGIEGALFLAVTIPLLVWYERRSGFLARLRERGPESGSPPSAADS